MRGSWLSTSLWERTYASLFQTTAVGRLLLFLLHIRTSANVLGRVHVCATVDDDGELRVVAEPAIECHSKLKRSTSVRFHLDGAGRVVVSMDRAPSNYWAAECQSKVRAFM